MSYATNDGDKINRVGWGLGAFAALFGILVLVNAPRLMPALLPAVGSAFAFDPHFLPFGLAVVSLWVLNAMLFAIVFADGHWRLLTRQLDVALTSVWGAALLFLAIGPRIFVSEATDQTAKLWIGFVLVAVMLSLIPKVRRAVNG